MSSNLPEHVTCATWGAQFTDVALWQPAIRAVWAMSPALQTLTGPPEAHVEAGFPGTCAVFVVARAAVIKFFPPFTHEDYERELYCLGHLRAVPHRPVLLAGGVLRDRIDWPYLVTRFEPGHVWRDQRLAMPTGAQHKVAADLGRMLRTVHRHALGSGPMWPAAAWWPALLVKRLRELPDELARMTQLPQQVIREATDRLAATDWGAEPGVLVHGDVTADHVLMEERAGRWRLSSLIDWADAEVAGPAYEWVALWFGFCDRDAGLFRAVLAAYDPDLVLDEAFVRTLLGFTLLHRFGPLTIGQVISPTDQRACRSLDQLCRWLFPGLP